MYKANVFSEVMLPFKCDIYTNVQKFEVSKLVLKEEGATF